MASMGRAGTGWLVVDVLQDSKRESIGAAVASSSSSIFNHVTVNSWYQDPRLQVRYVVLLDSSVCS